MAAQLQCSSVQLQQCEEIMKSHKCPSPIHSAQDLWSMLLEGKPIDHIYYWIDNQAQICAELYSKALTIAQSSDPEYWVYKAEPIPGTQYTEEIAHLVEVCWLDVKGDFNTKKLSPGIEYEILFDIELTRCATGWDRPVTFEYKSPTGTGRFEQNLSSLIGKGRRHVSIGKFMNLPFCIPASLSLHMFEHGNLGKTGLIMRGVIIKPACN